MLHDGFDASAEDIVEMLDDTQYWPEEELPLFDDPEGTTDVDWLVGDLSADLD